MIVKTAPAVRPENHNGSKFSTPDCCRRGFTQRSGTNTDESLSNQDAQIAQEGSPHDLYDAPQSEFIAEFLLESHRAVWTHRSDCLWLLSLRGRLMIRLRRPRFHHESPWGNWRVVEAGPSSIVKVITIEAGHRLSLQYHLHRSEHWVVVSGRGLVTLGNDVVPVEQSTHIYVPTETKHRIQNNGDQDLCLIEVQLGNRLDENDIVRIEDDYHR